MEENEAVETSPSNFVVANEDDDELEGFEELRKATVGRAPTETIQCRECGATCVLRRVALERHTNIDEGSAMLVKSKEDPESSQTSIS